MANEDLPRLLRAMASGTDAIENKHDIILLAAADEIDRLRDVFVALQNLICMAQNESSLHRQPDWQEVITAAINATAHTSTRRESDG